MSLEVHIYGSGFGETIFLRWPRAGGGWHGALVDAHSPREGRWLEDKLRALELSKLECAIATHPHLDHIFNLAAGLARSGVTLKRGYYWPGLSVSYWLPFFGRLAAQRGGDLPQTARMIRQWFGYLDLGIQEMELHAHDIGGREAFEPFYVAPTQAHSLLFIAIGPWLDEMNRFVRNVSGSFGSSGRIDYKHRDANAVSVALLVKYGDAQVVLGGDMEGINWDFLSKAACRPTFCPSVVKVSHHGSFNGRIEGMWPEVGGFFDNKPDGAVAVVTPWRRGGDKLPEDEVLNEIRRAGFNVYVTASGSFRYRNPDSHVSLRVQPDGAVETIEISKDVRTV